MAAKVSESSARRSTPSTFAPRTASVGRTRMRLMVASSVVRSGAESTQRTQRTQRSDYESVAKSPRHHGGHGGQEVQTCPQQDFSSASPVSSVVESLILQCALCRFRFVSIVSFVFDQRVQSSRLQRETGS